MFPSACTCGVPQPPQACGADPGLGHARWVVTARSDCAMLWRSYSPRSNFTVYFKATLAIYFYLISKVKMNDVIEGSVELVGFI
ncbi:hypothetical protein CCUS01_04809 [Colletotrichum cuscutae]|uniref:Uncharacterized protein n=1 Tax=Colletotrichum cuscutae TaxID=1209917 RepID=A0AAI9Y5H0_9PEZI|nr:hypothetical protein CCUS01_04809 [Colletotrichum cuscutae]